MKFLFLLLISGFTGTFYAQTGTDSLVKEPRETIDALFSAMQKGDSTLARSVFSENAQMTSSYVDKNGIQRVHAGSVDAFVSAIGTPHDAIWDERVSNLTIQKDGGLAQAWMDYEFYLGEQFSHCGVNAIQLVLKGNDWKIISIADTRRPQDECAILRKIEIRD